MKHGKQVTLNAYIIAILTLIVGAIISLESNDWQWFSRSGSLLVINGIILTSRQIIEHIQQLKHLQRHAHQSLRDWAKGDKNHLIKEYHELQWRDEKYGLYMLIAGTFIWGFGDLVGYIA